MATLDVTEVLTCPEFTDTVELIKRSQTVNSNGRMQIIETSEMIIAVVQNANTEELERLPESARYSDVIVVYYKGKLQAQSENGYADVVLWQGKRYQVKEVSEDFINYGAGFTKAMCLTEQVSV